MSVRKKRKSSRSNAFLQLIIRQRKPLSETLKEAGATMFNLSLWLKHAKFARKLKTAMKRRRQMEDLTMTLSRMWASSEYAERLQECVKPEPPEMTEAQKEARDHKFKHDAAALEILRKASLRPSRTSVEEPEPTERSFIHPDVPMAERAALMDRLPKKAA